MKHLFALLLCVITSASFAQYQTYADHELIYTMGYTSLQLDFKNGNLIDKYELPGKNPEYGFYSAYDNSLYTCDGKKIRKIDKDYITPSTETICTRLLYNESPKPYAMLEMSLVIDTVDYENNMMRLIGDGVTVTVITTDDEIDAIYKYFYKKGSIIGKPYHRFVFRNWSYDPESRLTYDDATVKYKKKKKYKGKAAKNEERLLHESEFGTKHEY